VHRHVVASSGQQRAVATAITDQFRGPVDHASNLPRSGLVQHNFTLYDKLNAKQESLGKFRPTMTHSLYEPNTHIVYFHPQVLADWNKIAEIAGRFLKQW